MTGTDKSNHGGKREGAGRKRKFDKLVRATVTLLPEHAEFLQHLGNGNLTEGIRKAIRTMDLQQLAQKYGTVTHEGTEYTLTAVADFSSRLFDGNGLDANEGEEYTVEFSCPAVDNEGNHYEVYWQFDGIIKGEEPAPDMYDWVHGDEHITRIVPQ